MSAPAAIANSLFLRVKRRSYGSGWFLVLRKKARGEIVVSDADKVTCGELLDNLLAHYEAGNAKPTTIRVFRCCIEANLKPYIGNMKATTLSTSKLKA